jgi:putative ABC transport system permease protein
LEGLSSGQVVLGSVLALRRGLGIGDTLELQGDAGKTQLKVAAITNDYLAGGLTIYMDRQHARQSLGIDGMDAVIVNAASDQLASVEAQLQAVCQQQGLILQSYAQLIQQIDGMINRVVGSLWTLLALGCAIAAMGLINTLTMNILEQTREIGMLRVVAMTRWQVRVMICTQALILGLLGIVPGIVIGVLVQYVMEMPAAAFRGTTIQFVFRPGLFLGVGLIGLVLVLLASWIPAERAARLKLQSALQYE